MMLRQYDSEAKANALAPHLRGGQFKILAAGKQRRPVLEYASEWDSDEQAIQFLAAYRKVLRGKWKSCDPSIDKEDIFAGTGDNGYFVSRRAANTVWSVEGLGDATEWQRLKAAQPVESAVRIVFKPNLLTGPVTLH
jgi:hypothetical protein